jgi:hypothetical protein
MTTTRDLAIHAERIDTGPLLSEWAWLLPPRDIPLLVGAFGDCVFGAPDGSHWVLSMLEGDYRRVAGDSAEFNRLKNDAANLNDWFSAEWVSIAAGNGIVPAPDQCLGWKVHPILGAPFSVENIGLFSVRVYHSVVGQLFRQLSNR